MRIMLTLQGGEFMPLVSHFPSCMELALMWLCYNAGVNQHMPVFLGPKLAYMELALVYDPKTGSRLAYNDARTCMSAVHIRDALLWVWFFMR